MKDQNKRGSNIKVVANSPLTAQKGAGAPVVENKDQKKEGVPFSCRSIRATVTPNQVKAAIPDIVGKTNAREAAAALVGGAAARAGGGRLSAAAAVPTKGGGVSSKPSSGRRSMWDVATPPAAQASGKGKDALPPPTPPSIRDDLPLDPPVFPEPSDKRADARWTVGKYVIRADFDSANLAKVQASPGNPAELELWTTPDNAGTENESAHRTWFYFGVKGFARGETVYFSVMNLNRQSKLFTHDMRPVHRAHPSMPHWERTGAPVAFQNADTEDDRAFQVRFKHRFDHPAEDEVFFAFCEPYSCEDQEACLQRIEADFRSPGSPRAQAIYYKRETLCYSLNAMPLHLITITSHEGAAEEEEERLPGLFPDLANPRAKQFPGKKVFFISSRVHPGETPASHMFNGVLGFLLRLADPRAAAARQHFVFKLIPILNPDGVSLGHYRMDTLGRNLNRYYDAPSPQEHPSIFASRSVILHYAEKSMLDIFIDLHAHANKRGCFLFGNALDGPAQVENVLLAKLAAVNCPFFDFQGCDFTEKNMCARDRRDPQVSKEGSGRVALYRATGITHIYTCETNYNTSRIQNIVQPIRDPREEAAAARREEAMTKEEAAAARRKALLAASRPSHKDGANLQQAREVSRHASPPSRGRDPVKYGAEEFASMGRSLVVSALDLREVNPWPRLPNTEFKTLNGVRAWVAACLRAQATRKDMRHSIKASKDDDDE